MPELSRITLNPNVGLGRPTIRGMRITVGVILKMLAAGKSTADIREAYPELEADDVAQALQYAAAVPAWRDASIPVPRPDFEQALHVAVRCKGPETGRRIAS